MRLHVLVGCRELMRPEQLPAVTLAALLGGQVRPATALWLPEPPGAGYHDFLLDPAEDRRIEVFAAALRDNFGRRFEPLVALPDLLPGVPGPAAERAPDRARPPLEALAALWRRRPAATLALHALALPAGIDGGDGWAGAAGLTAAALAGQLEELRAGLAAEGAGAVEAAVIAPGPGGPVFAALMRNALARQIAARAGSSLAPHGLAAELPPLRAAAARLLEGWGRAGIVPSRPLAARDLDRLAARALAALIAHVPADAPS